MQADGLKHLESGGNRGDGGDPFPGTSGNDSLTATSNPNTMSYGGLDANVAITNMVIGANGVKAAVKVRGAAPAPRKAAKKAAKKAVKKKPGRKR